MQLFDIIIQNKTATIQPWTIILPAFLAIVGIIVGASLANNGQKRRDRDSAAQAIRAMALDAATSALHHAGNVSSLIELGRMPQPTKEILSRVAEHSRTTTASSAEALAAAAVLTGVADDQVAKQGSKLHWSLTKLSQKLIPLLRDKDFEGCHKAFVPLRDEITKECNVLIFMVQARDQLVDGGAWLGVPYFRTQDQANNYYLLNTHESKIPSDKD